MSFKSSFTTPAVAAISFCLIGGTTPAYADLGDQLFKLLPDDGAEQDHFSESVGIGGATAIAGAHRHDDNGADSGSAYLFDTTTGRQIAKLLPNDGAANDLFGLSVAIGGATAIVGAPGDDDNGLGSGSAYLFDISDPANPAQIFKLLPDDGGFADFFGRSVAISGTIAVIGTCCSAYLFDISDPANPAQIFKLLPDDGAPTNFGYSVAISGTTAIVGAL